MCEKDIAVERFFNGDSISDIANDIGLSWAKVYQMISGRLPCSVNLSDYDKQEIGRLYSGGMSCPKIAEMYRINHKLVGRVLDDLGIKRVHNGVRKYQLNETYFDNLDSDNKAYILGLLYADGYNDPHKATIRLQLQCEDVHILESIRKEFESARPLKFIKCSDHVASNGFVSKDMYSFECYSSHMCKRLSDIGMVNCKSLVQKYPDIQSCFDRSFIRGYFDGDGSFCHSYVTTQNRFQDQITITSTNDFCTRALEIIRNNISIGGAIYDASCMNGVTKVISISGRNQCKLFLDWLYDGNPSLYLKRKYKKYLDTYYS